MTHTQVPAGWVDASTNYFLSKLHLADRTQDAVYAWREGIMHHTAVSGDTA
jgi:hypothetical protein